MRQFAVPTACAALLLATGAQAAPDVTPDVRCLIAMSALASTKGHQAAGMLGIYFFAGRIVRVDPAFDFPAGIRAQAARMNPPIMLAELKRCGPIVQSVAQALSATQQSMRPSRQPGIEPVPPPPAGLRVAPPPPSSKPLSPAFQP